MSNVNFHPLQVVGRGSETQLQVGENVIEMTTKLFFNCMAVEMKSINKNKTFHLTCSDPVSNVEKGVISSLVTLCFVVIIIAVSCYVRRLWVKRKQKLYNSRCVPYSLQVTLNILKHFEKIT